MCPPSAITAQKVQHRFLSDSFEYRTSRMSSQAMSDLATLPQDVSSQLDNNEEFWWQGTGRTLLSMLHHAGYDLDALMRNLSLYRSVIVPWMGSRPTNEGKPQSWRSYVTDDHSPIEYSWSWEGASDKKPKVRFTVEAVGKQSGSNTDPYNRLATKQLLSQLCRYSTDIDLTIHSHFEDELVASGTDKSSDGIRLPPGTHRSSMFIAAELEDTGTSVKTYFMPMLKAIELNQTRANVLFHSIERLERDHPEISFPAFKTLSTYMGNDPLGTHCEVEMIAVDCVKPSQSRVKIYLRSQDTSWDTVRSILTMNGQISISQQALANLRTLWQLVLGLEPNFSSVDQLPQCQRSEAGTFYCFWARPGDQALTCKLYIPAKYYGKNDRAIAQGLSRYLQSYG